MASNLPVLSDHFLVQYILGKLVNQVTGCELVEDANIDEMEDYPFFTFKWIDFDQEPNADWLGKHRQYICTMQIDCHSNSSVQAMSLARKLFEALHEVPYRRFFKQAYIVPQSIGNTGDRTTLQGINYDHDFGFDCSFTVTGGFEFLEKTSTLMSRITQLNQLKAHQALSAVIPTALLMCPKIRRKFNGRC